jgi:Tetratricopeptide repeat
METRTRALGQEHPDTLISMNNLAFTWKGQGRDEEALMLMKNCFQLQRRILGPDHPFTMESLAALDDWKMDNK